MAQNLLVMVPLAGLSLVGIVLLVRRKGKKGKEKFGAFIEEFEILPPPPPPPPAALPPLSGLTFAVKDIFELEGRVTGFGNPDWQRTHEAALHTAPVVEELLKAGAKCVGKTHMDEMAYSINGENRHYGTPTNPAAPGHVPGGSSSGSAVAVAAGLVDFALGTDTGGSVRVPAAFCGVLGFRPSHGAVPEEGVLPMAPSFDTVGCFARDAGVLRAVGHVMLQQPYGALRAPKKVLIADDLFEMAAGPERGALDALMRSTEALLGRVMQRIQLGRYLSSRLPSLGPFLPRHEANGDRGDKDAGRATLTAVRDALRVLQGYEFATCHGEWVSATKPKLAPEIASRVKFAFACSEEHAQLAQKVRDEMRAAMSDLLKDDALLALPTVGGLPPKLRTKPEALEEFRARAFTLLGVAGMAGCPQVSMPAGTADGTATGVPLAVSLVARYGADGFLLDATTAFAKQIAEEAAAAAEATRKAPPSASKSLLPSAPASAAELAKERGNEAYKEKKYEQAVEAYSEALQLDSGSATYYSNRAMAHLQLCNFQEAEADCTSALEIDKRNVKAMLRRGTAREFLGYYGDAIDDFEQALVYEPTNKTAAEAIQRIRSSGLV